MARPLRIQYPGAVYHVMNRGAARQTIFLDGGDYHENPHDEGPIFGRSFSFLDGFLFLLFFKPLILRVLTFIFVGEKKPRCLWDGFLVYALP